VQVAASSLWTLEATARCEMRNKRECSTCGPCGLCVISCRCVR
jgi:hypothetical protein